MSFEALEKALLEASEVELVGLMRRSSNYTFLTRVCGPGDAERLAVYKPARGEAPLWDFQDGTLYRREVAAYRLSRLLGWPRIPATVVRDEAPHGVGALQVFIDAQPGHHYLHLNGQPDSVWREVAIFDFITNNADRKSGHCLLDPDGGYWVVDHGLTFHVEPKLRTVIWDFAGQPLPDELRPALERARSEVASFSEFLSRSEVAALRRRLTAVLESGWELPSPTSGWSVPWPPI